MAGAEESAEEEEKDLPCRRRRSSSLAAAAEGGGRGRRQECDPARGVEVLEQGEADEEDGAHGQARRLGDLAEAPGRP